MCFVSYNFTMPHCPTILTSCVAERQSNNEKCCVFQVTFITTIFIKTFLNVEDAKTWLENVFFTFLDHLIKFRYVILRYASKQTHIQTHSSQYFAPVSVRNNLHRISVFRLVKFISLGHRLGTHTHRHTRPSALPGSRHFESLLSRRYVEAPRHSGST